MARNSGKNKGHQKEESLYRIGSMHVKSVDAQTSSRWCGVEVRRGGCRPRHLTMVQNYEVHRLKPSSS
ncbi:hypothetical protein TNCV_3712021 [Trichonephila clavipes]|uniref:Uncharacterized protein n=1 Tax=Trichonephila clavipes TaxID=2585209 RepID=A0A8X6R925_TRICX|nr:hypothetical protein TNCV_3712021 [Trichonephila clavipes]